MPTAVIGDYDPTWLDAGLIGTLFRRWHCDGAGQRILTELAGNVASVAFLYQAELVPSKIEILNSWVPSRPWLAGVDRSALEPVGTYRFDDPDGEVGIETHLLRTADGQVIQVPVTYRGAPLEDAASLLITTTQHSILGQRWVYDACGDPVYARALATTVLTGGCEAELDLVTESGLQRRGEPTVRVRGSGVAGTEVPPVGAVRYTAEDRFSVIATEDLELLVLRVVGNDTNEGHGAPTLTGTWPGRDEPALLAWAAVTTPA